MYFDRPALKREARQALRATRPRAMLVTLLFYLLTSGLPAFTSFFIADPAVLFSELTQQGLAPHHSLFMILNDIGISGVFLYILLAAFARVLSFGYRRWALNVSRGEKADINDLVYGFSMVGKVLWLDILTVAYLLLWSMFLLMCGGLLMMLPALLPSALSFAIMISAAYVLFFLGFAFFITRYLRCSLAHIILLDHPEMSALQALRQSLKLMSGQTARLFLLYLSFIGWFLLCIPAALLLAVLALLLPALGTAATIFATALLNMWLMAYTTVTVCRFYDWLPRPQVSEPSFDL